MKAEIKLSRLEWDFRGVDDPALPCATAWEYCRTNTVVRDAAISWLSTRVDGKSLQAHLLEAFKKTPHEPLAAWSLLPRHVRALTVGPDVPNIPVELLDMLLHKRPDFPAPWL